MLRLLCDDGLYENREQTTHILPDDNRVLLAARAEARRNFDENRRVGIDTGLQINNAIEVAHILRHNIVQGARADGNEDAKWGMYYRPLPREDPKTSRVTDRVPDCVLTPELQS